MSSYAVRLLESAIRDFARLDKSVAQRISNRLEWFAAHLPELRAEPLAGDLTGFYKLRIGDYRVIYEIREPECLLIVHAVGHRREIYRTR
ncbi:MAG: Plasmid stabilization system protein [Chloroflexi bacterium ADurb.Bin360]|nr:MAG: Plasmid stabilization system protein [Chloroflexi bacterium ADurb.Bin360]